VITLNTANSVYLILSSYQEKGYLDFQMERFTVSDFVDVLCAYRKVLSCKAVLTYVQTTCRVVQLHVNVVMVVKPQLHRAASVFRNICSCVVCS